MIGIVTTELRSESGGEHQGRITYENRGECFFLPYGKEDVEGYVTLKPGDKVSFQIATNQRLEIVSCTFHFMLYVYHFELSSQEFMVIVIICLFRIDEK